MREHEIKKEDGKLTDYEYRTLKVVQRITRQHPEADVTIKLVAFLRERSKVSISTHLDDLYVKGYLKIKLVGKIQYYTLTLKGTQCD